MNKEHRDIYKELWKQFKLGSKSIKAIDRHCFETNNSVLKKERVNKRLYLPISVEMKEDAINETGLSSPVFDWCKYLCISRNVDDFLTCWQSTYDLTQREFHYNSKRTLYLHIPAIYMDTGRYLVYFTDKGQEKTRIGKFRVTSDRKVGLAFMWVIRGSKGLYVEPFHRCKHNEFYKYLAESALTSKGYKVVWPHLTNSLQLQSKTVGLQLINGSNLDVPYDYAYRRDGVLCTTMKDQSFYPVPIHYTQGFDGFIKNFCFDRNVDAVELGEVVES